MPISHIMASHAPKKSRARGQQAALDAFLEDNPDARTQRWRNAVKRSFAALEDVAAFQDDFHGMLDKIRFVPDAYIINTAENYLHFIEVEVFSPMSPRKLQHYGKMAIDLNFYGIDFGVYTINQHGHIEAVDLLPHYVAWIKDSRP